MRVLGNLLELDGFDQASSQQVRDSLQQRIGDVEVDYTEYGEFVGYLESGGGLQRIAYLPMYAVDGVVRRASALQKTADGDVASVCLNPADANRLGLAEGDTSTLERES